MQIGLPARGRSRGHKGSARSHRSRVRPLPSQARRGALWAAASSTGVAQPRAVQLSCERNCKRSLGMVLTLIGLSLSPSFGCLARLPILATPCCALSKQLRYSLCLAICSKRLTGSAQCSLGWLSASLLERLISSRRAANAQMGDCAAISLGSGLE